MKEELFEKLHDPFSIREIRKMLRCSKLNCARNGILLSRQILVQENDDCSHVD
jgi:hypothetical protein